MSQLDLVDVKLCFLSVLLGFSIGGLIFDGIKVGEEEIHTEKHGCEYVEKAECKQVWIKKGE